MKKNIALSTAIALTLQIVIAEGWLVPTDAALWRQKEFEQQDLDGLNPTQQIVWSDPGSNATTLQ
jgi:hypothetical protein